ncbi:MAG: ABC transporter ATP-binding protein [Desulfarculus sp.]|nr:ABC transporter ATP-binding protein [Desulfarculus sp.]
MSEPIITVEGLGKRYRLGVARPQGQSKLRAVLSALASPFRYLGQSVRQASEDEILWALKDVSFQVGQGEVLGIIGRNGAGKSTLLKVLARITDPTLGRAVLHGRVGCLLQVGTGFHPELSGRENTYLNGAIMGMKKAEINRKFEEIMDFAGVERFVDTPVKYYSSGMYVRLAFAVAAHLEPEILIVDEVLAVGDAAFQKKCLGKMSHVAQEGRTVLFVSHNMEAILGLCSRALWLESGQLVQDGDPQEVVQAYNRHCLEGVASLDEGLFQDFNRPGDGRLRFTGFGLRDEGGAPSNFAVTGQTVDFVLPYRTQGQPVDNVTVWMWIHDLTGRQMLCLWSKMTGQDFERLPPRGEVVCRVPRFPLVPGTYTLDFNAVINGLRADRLVGAARLEVMPGDFFGSGRDLRGPFVCDQSWSRQELPGEGQP